MRFMMIVKASAESEAGILPSEQLLADMAKYNEQMAKAGILLDGLGLQSSSKGARVKLVGDRRIVTDGPFAETKELIAGFWMIRVNSLQEAIEWAKRCPSSPQRHEDSEIEIRQVFELEDFNQGPAIEHHRRVEKLTEKNKQS